MTKLILLLTATLTLINCQSISGNDTTTSEPKQSLTIDSTHYNWEGMSLNYFTGDNSYMDGNSHDTARVRICHPSQQANLWSWGVRITVWDWDMKETKTVTPGEIGLTENSIYHADKNTLALSLKDIDAEIEQYYIILKITIVLELTK